MTTIVVANSCKCYYLTPMYRLLLLVVELVNRFISMYYYRSVYTLWNRRVHSVIDDITGPVARAGPAEAALPAEEANQIPPGGLIE